MLPTGQGYVPPVVKKVLNGIERYCMVLHRVTLYCMVLHGETGKLGQSVKERTKKSFYLGYFPKPMAPPPSPLSTHLGNFLSFFTEKSFFLAKKTYFGVFRSPSLI